MPATSQASSTQRFPWFTFGCLYALLVTLNVWSWQKWDHVWVERSEEFLPPESRQLGHSDEFAWQYPVYRSNDTYQWVHLADSLSEGDSSVLNYRKDEGPPDGRPNSWSSGLARLLNVGGQLNAWAHGWPATRGIHDLAHWIGAVMMCIILAWATELIRRLAGLWAAILFALLYFFNAAIRWDFAFSRLDHDVLLQLFFILQILGLSGILRAFPGKTSETKYWAFLAGLGSGGGWWVGATVQAAIGAITTLGCILALVTSGSSQQDGGSGLNLKAKAFILWGLSASVFILFFLALEGRLRPSTSIASIHPIFIAAQTGAALLCASAASPLGRSKTLLFSAGLLIGLMPLYWIGIYGKDAHIWFDPFMRRLHDLIIEFQSPFKNGCWNRAIGLQAALAAMLALACVRYKEPSYRFGITLILALLVLSMLQTRWLGLLATASTIVLALSIDKRLIVKSVSIVLVCILAGSWWWHWDQIEENPGPEFVADMFLQVGSRDLNLNLQAYTGNQVALVAIPYAFSATSALFPTIHPLGTFYWENRTGLEQSAAIFAAGDDSNALELAQANNVRYLAVQAGPLGGPFAKLVAWAARKTMAPEQIETTLAWRLSSGYHVPEWCRELPFYGSFDPRQFPVRIYEIISADKGVESLVEH